MSGDVPWVTLETGEGPARAQVHRPAGEPVGTLVLGHGAGGGAGAADLQSMLAATDRGWAVALVEQPWRVAGRRIATAPPRLDAAWRDLLPDLLRAQQLPAPLVVGGRSAGARVACRTCPGGSGMPPADAVLCLAFPLHPPGRPDRSRAPELAVPLRRGLPTLVVQGRADPFGSPGEVREAAARHEPGPVGGAPQTLEVVEVPGNHAPSRDQDLVARTVLDWLARWGPPGQAAASDNARRAD